MPRSERDAASASPGRWFADLQSVRLTGVGALVTAYLTPRQDAALDRSRARKLSLGGLVRVLERAGPVTTL